MEENLQIEWLQLCKKYSEDYELLNSMWKDIKKKYTNRKRHYHNLSHIYSMLTQADECDTQIVDMDIIKFAIWFHDIIYNSAKKDNEEKSADYTLKVLTPFSLLNRRKKKISQFIYSTKAHQIEDFKNQDNAFLLDFDLSILGQDWQTYYEYIRNIRKEYKMYPDFLYKPARKKVLQSFLSRETLYFTKKYKAQYESNARLNIEKEIKLLF